MRYILSCFAGIAVSLALFLMMTYLIEKHDPPSVISPTEFPEFVAYEKLETQPIDAQAVEPPPIINPQPSFQPQDFPLPSLNPIDAPTRPTQVRVANTSKIEGTPQLPDFGDITPPDLTVLVGSKVKYPSSALRKNIEGYVVVENEVDKYGKVVDVRIIESSHQVFERAARDAVFKWKYSNSELNKRIDKKRIAFKLDH